MLLSNNCMASIETLPVELLHRIFDHLDTETILFSIRPLCRLFRSIVNTYDRYILNLKIISKSTFDLLCRLIHPENIISLTLSNYEETFNQIDLFISNVSLDQLTRLRSLTLLDINEGQLNSLLKHMNCKSLISFSFSIGKYDNRRRKQTLNLLSSILAQSTLRKLELNIYNDRTNLGSLCTIFQSASYLHTLIMKDIPTMMTSISFQQLKSLTFNDLRVTIDVVESLLLMTSSIVYLKLIGGENMMNGKRWEQFITKNLPHLDQFEFYFNEQKSTAQPEEDFKLILSSFRTPFWIEYKKWFVICEYRKRFPYVINLYSIPICKSSLEYETDSYKICLSTDPPMSETTMGNQCHSLSLTLAKELAEDIQDKEMITNHPLFPQVTDINLYFVENWPLISLQKLSIFIDLTRIVHMQMYSYYFDRYNHDTWMDVIMFMEGAHNLSALILLGSFSTSVSDETVVNIYSNLPRQIKYLKITINDVEQIKNILERCENLAIIKFLCHNRRFIRQVIDWFAENTINTKCRQSYKMVSVWLGKIKIQSTAISNARKRLKLDLQK